MPDAVAFEEFTSHLPPVRVAASAAGDVFTGRSPDPGAARVFGGWLVAQALYAAGLTAPEDRPVHALHTSFLRPADPERDLRYEVERPLDGRTLSHRQVTVTQAGRPVVRLTASFRLRGGGLTAGHQAAMPKAPDPQSLPTLQERAATAAHQPRHAALTRGHPVDVRPVEAPSWEEAQPRPREPRNLVWMRIDGTLPDDAMTHACAVAYASDFTLLDTLVLPHLAETGGRWLPRASLDHAVWFHRAPRADAWWLYEQHGTALVDGHGFARGELFAQDGTHVASVAQQALLLPPDE